LAIGHTAEGKELKLVLWLTFCWLYTPLKG